MAHVSSDYLAWLFAFLYGDKNPKNPWKLIYLRCWDSQENFPDPFFWIRCLPYVSLRYIICVCVWYAIQLARGREYERFIHTVKSTHKELEQLELLETGTGKDQVKPEGRQFGPQSSYPVWIFLCVLMFLSQSRKHLLKQKRFLCPINENEMMIWINMCTQPWHNSRGRCSWGYL